MIARFSLSSTPREGIRLSLPSSSGPKAFPSKGAAHSSPISGSVNPFRGRFFGVRKDLPEDSGGPGRCGARILHVRAALA